MASRDMRKRRGREKEKEVRLRIFANRRLLQRIMANREKTMRSCLWPRECENSILIQRIMEVMKCTRTLSSMLITVILDMDMIRPTDGMETNLSMRSL